LVIGFIAHLYTCFKSETRTEDDTKHKREEEADIQTYIPKLYRKVLNNEGRIINARKYYYAQKDILHMVKTSMPYSSPFKSTVLIYTSTNICISLFSTLFMARWSGKFPAFMEP
jgi:hypothetical protein